MNTVIIIGAGATRAEARSSYQRRDKRPPLDTTFFELCGLRKLEGREVLLNYMKFNYGINPFDNGGTTYRMEEIFNYVYSDAFSVNPPPNCLDAYWSLIRMYSKALALTTNPLSGTSRSGVGALLRYVWKKRQSENITFITFNQDLVIEKAIENAIATKTYSSIPWNIRNAYNMEFEKFTGRRGATKKFKETGEETIRILKLHGSLNWYYRVRSRDDPQNSIRTPSSNLHCVNAQRISTSLTFRPNIRTVKMVPFVVPPIYEKSSIYRDALGGLWEEASKVLVEADKLIVFGYSFPDTDFASLSLFRRSFQLNTTLNEVTVIDIDPVVASKISKLLKAEISHFYSKIPIFINSS